MSPTRAARVQRGVSWVFMVIATIAIVIGYVRLDNNQQDLQATNGHLCEAVLLLTKPTSEAGVTDSFTLARIRASNSLKADARDKLNRTFACDG